MHTDFKDLLSIFNASRVEYLVVGALSAGRPQDLADVHYLKGK